MRRHLRNLGALALAVTAAGALSLATAQPVRELVIAQGIDHEGWDIHDHNTTAIEAIHVNVFDYLVFKDADGVLQPALATSWERIDDTATRFLLREGVLWHDGETFTAEDVKFTLERVANDSSLQEYGQYRQIREVEIVGPYEIIIHTRDRDGNPAPEPVLLSRLSRIGSGILAKHHIEAIGGWENISEHLPVGTGPFKVTEWRRDERIVMEAFDEHWRGRPVWDRLIHRTIPEASTRVAELLTGGVHIATNIPPADKSRVEASANVRIEPWPTPRVMMYIMNTQGEGTSDLRVRTAIEYAIDSELLIDALFDGLGAPVRGRASPGITAAPMEFYDTQIYDPERAVELLAEAGYGPGELTIHIQGPAGRYPLDTEIIELTAVMLEAVGINTTLEILEWSAYQSRVWTQPDAVQHMALIGLGNSLGDAALTYNAVMCDGSYAMMSRWCDAHFDEIYSQALSEMDDVRRAELFREIFTIVADERIYIHLFQLENMAGVANSIEWSPRPDEYLWMFDARAVD